MKATVKKFAAVALEEIVNSSNSKLTRSNPIRRFGGGQIRSYLNGLKDIPKELWEIRQWVLCRLGKPDPTSGKRPKIPVSYNGSLARVDDPSTWATIPELIEALSKHLKTKSTHYLLWL
jgi:hypothetical protein